MLILGVTNYCMFHYLHANKVLSPQNEYAAMC